MATMKTTLTTGEVLELAVLAAACGKDVRGAAKITIDRLVERVGAERVKTAFRRG